MEFESPNTLLEPKTEIDLDLSLEELDAILEIDVLNTVPPLINPIQPCWVARAVYGESNPDWMVFRDWLMNEAPAWFRSLYIRHGERVARGIQPHRRIKAVLRAAMDRVVAPRR
jgi:hypothetical protein